MKFYEMNATAAYTCIPRQRPKTALIGDPSLMPSELTTLSRQLPDEKAVHLLIARIEAKREKDNTDFNIESTLKPVLENMS